MTTSAPLASQAGRSHIYLPKCNVGMTTVRTGLSPIGRHPRAAEALAEAQGLPSPSPKATPVNGDAFGTLNFMSYIHHSRHTHFV